LLLPDMRNEVWDTHASSLGVTSQLLLHSHQLFPCRPLPWRRHALRWLLCLHRDSVSMDAKVWCCCSVFSLKAQGPWATFG
jgi:hypothetical protein